MTMRERLAGEVLPGHPAEFLKEQTTHFAAADPDLTVSVTQSLGSPFGSGVVAPGTGVFLNNFLYWTDLDPESPNCLRGGDKLELMLSPTQGFRDVLAIGTQLRPDLYDVMAALRGSDRRRQDERPRVHVPGVHRQRAVRPHPEPLGARVVAGRIERRVGGGPGRRPGAAGHRHRRRRLYPHPRGVLWPGRAEADERLLR